MKNFKDYLFESSKKWNFKIKVAGDFNDDKAKMMEALLNKFQVCEFKKLGKTPIQELPLDFPKIKYAEVNIFEATLDYPTTQSELHDYLANSMGITKDALVVRSPFEPSEQYQMPKEIREEPLLTDPTYSEADNAKFDDYYGDKYNTGFVKELNEILKLQRKARGETIPNEGKAKFNTDSAQSNLGPVSGSKLKKKK
jgi:hypothetical protein